MKRQNESVWNTNAGRPLIRHNPALTGTAFTLVPATCSRDELRELGEAIADALKHTEEVDDARHND